jgi:hypothetical protein
VTTTCSYLALGTRLGGAADEGLLQRARSFQPGASVETIRSGTGDLTGTRIILDLGTVDLDSQQDDVTATERQLGGLGLLTRWRDVKLRMARLGH